jgi:hypothetical protein
MKKRYTLLETLNNKHVCVPTMCAVFIVLFGLSNSLINGFYRHIQHQILGGLVINELEKMGKDAVLNYLEVL